MTSSYLLSSTRNTTTTTSYLPKHHYKQFNNEPKRDILVLKPQSSPPKSSHSILRLRTSGFTHPLASLSSYAEADGRGHGEIIGPHHEHQVKVDGHDHHEEKKTDNDLPGMAQAFNISSSTAIAIAICIALAALTFPFFMKSLGPGLPLKTRLLSYATLLLGFYMAWNIGANDVANAMGTSVGSGALTLRQAVLTAAVLEFSGALLMGKHVTSTMQNGILVANVFQGKDMLLFAGLFSSLGAAGTWLQVRSRELSPDSNHVGLLRPTLASKSRQLCSYIIESTLSPHHHISVQLAESFFLNVLFSRNNQISPRLPTFCDHHHHAIL